MTPPDAERERLASAIADGLPLDWARIEEQALLAPQEIRALRTLEALRQWAAGRPPLTSAGALDSAPLEVGFELLGALGRGTTGQVWRARDRALEREVALKILHDDMPMGALARGRFVQEARLLASVEHPNVVRVHSISEEGGHLRMSLELVHGATLEKITREQGPFSAQEAARIGVDLCAALAALHAKGLVHRDMKPGNVMREHGGRTVLLDFSLARAIQAGQPAWTSAQAGTPLFMAPEQFEGREPIGPAADIYGLGALLYWLVALRHPCAGDTFGEVRARAVEGRITPLLDACPQAPRAFAAVLERALRRDPRERFATAGTMEQELRAFLAAPRRGARAGSWAAVGALVGVLGTVAFWTSKAWGKEQRFDPRDALLAPDPKPGNLFGGVLITDGKRVVVASTDEDGRVCVFARRGDEWVVEQVISAPAAATQSQFGSALALRGDWLLIGAAHADDHGKSSGAVHGFRRDGVSGAWSPTFELRAPDSDAGDCLGTAVEWSGDLLFVGAASKEVAARDRLGQVHVFRWDGSSFAFETSLSAPEGRAGDNFGNALSFDGGRLAVGAYAADTGNGKDSGAIYLFRQQGSAWILEQTLLGSAAGQHAGVSLSLAGNLLVYGEHENPARGRFAGAAFAWQRAASSDRWDGPELVYAPDTDDWDGFGRSVQLEGDQLLVGAPYASVHGHQGGTVDRFCRKGGVWEWVAQIAAPEPQADTFGYALCWSAGLLVVGAPATDRNGVVDTGAAYVLSMAEDP